MRLCIPTAYQRSSKASKTIITAQIFDVFHNAFYVPNMLSIYQLKFYKDSNKPGNREINLPFLLSSQNSGNYQLFFKNS